MAERTEGTSQGDENVRDAEGTRGAAGFVMHVSTSLISLSSISHLQVLHMRYVCVHLTPLAIRFSPTL